MSIAKSFRVFLCHASSDKYRVEVLYNQLLQDGIDAWYDSENLIPGQDWRYEIPKAVRNSHVVIVCLSNQSVTKEGYVQKEIKIALDTADEKPDGTIFIIPTRLENCDVPERIKKYQWVDLFSNDGYQRLFKALQVRAKSLGIVLKQNVVSEEENIQKGEYLFHKGREYSQEKDHDRAIEAFSSSIKFNPRHVGTWNLRGRAYMDRWARRSRSEEDLVKAIENFTMSLSLDDSAIALYRLRGEAYLYHEEYDKAISDLEKEIVSVKHDAHAHFMLGWAYHQKNNLDTAIYYYQKAIDLDSSHNLSYLYLAWAFVDTGNEGQAAASYKMALTLNPKLATFDRFVNPQKNYLWDDFKVRYDKGFFKSNIYGQ